MLLYLQDIVSVMMRMESKMLSLENRVLYLESEMHQMSVTGQYHGHASVMGVDSARARV